MMEQIQNTIEKAIMNFGRFDIGNKVYVHVSDAASVLVTYYREYFKTTGETFHKHPSIRHIVNWLDDNKGKGLLLYGACSQGKTLLARHIIPAILYDKMHKISHYYRMVEANRIPDEVKGYKIIILDDVGTEEEFNEYGNKRHSFNEIIDSVEQKEKLAIITTNLTFDEIEERYGTRTLERILATCTPVCFNMCKDYYKCKKSKLFDDICDKCEDFSLASFRR